MSGEAAPSSSVGERLLMGGSVMRCVKSSTVTREASEERSGTSVHRVLAGAVMRWG
jgi:hypothetical protein